MSRYLATVIVLLCIFWGLRSKINVYEYFLQGVKAGVIALWHILPAILGIFIAISLVRNSLVWGYIINKLAYLMNPLGIPEDTAALLLVRPFSGSASLAVLTQIFTASGPDSKSGLIASTFMASTETVFYVVMTYLTSVQIKHSRHILPVAIITQLIGLICTTFLWHLLA